MSDREKLIENRLREIGAVKRGKPAFYKDDPEDWVNAPLSVVLEAAALAAVPDETELAEVLDAHDWHECTNHCICGERPPGKDMTAHRARVVREWWEKKR